MLQLGLPSRLLQLDAASKCDMKYVLTAKGASTSNH